MTTTSLPSSQTRLQWLTLERLAYALLALAPLLIRLVNLGQRTLAPAEATTAWRAWQASQGLHPLMDAGQPLLYTLQSLTFFVMGATNATARMGPLLAAAALPWALYLARHWLGRPNALLAATLITFSPTINAFARRADGTTFALLAVGITLVGLAWLEQHPAWGWKTLLVGLALLLISGPAGYTALLTLLILLPLALRTQPDHPPIQARDGLPALVLLLLGGTGFLTRIDALGLTAVNLTQWLADFSFQPVSLLEGWIRLAVDEPMLSLFGLLGILWSLRRPGRGRALALAAALAGLIAILQGPDATYSRAVAALFLAFPAADLLIHLGRRGDLDFRSVEGTLFVVVLILLAFIATYALVSFAATGDFARLTVFLVTLFLALIMTLVFIFFIGWQEVRSGLIISTLILTLLFGLGSLWSLGFNTNLPILARVFPTEALPDAQDLVRTYGDLSEQQRGDRWAVPLLLIPGSPSDDLIQWQFRKAEAFQVANTIPADDPPPIIIAPADRELSMDHYAGQTFELLSDWDLTHITTSNQAIYWFFFRRSPLPPPAADQINLWVNLDLLSLDQPE